MVSVFTNNSTKNELTPEFKDFFISSFDLPATSTTFGPRIGSASVHGAIYPINTDNRRVVKVMYKPKDFGTDFDNEVRVGHIPGIERVGTRIYEYVYGETPNGMYIGAYVMDNLLSGESGANTKVMKLSEWLNLYYSSRGDKCPPRAENIDVIVYNYVKLLFDFYKITKGWHGDLHNGNIQVIVDKRQPGVIKRMRVIDYGTHTPFANPERLEQRGCIYDIVKDIREEFHAMSARYGEVLFWKYTGVKHKFPGKGMQPVIGNYASLISNPLFIYAYKSGIAKDVFFNLRNAVPKPKPKPPLGRVILKRTMKYWFGKKKIK